MKPKGTDVSKTLFYGIVLSLLLVGMPRLSEGATFDVVPAEAQIRDAVIDAQRAVAYLAAYDRNEVWKVDLQTREILTRIPVQRGPSALSISPDFSTVACVNRLDNSVSIIRAADSNSIATVTTGHGPCAVAALADGSFVVACSFSDSLTLIPADRPGEGQMIEGPGGVALAVSAAEHWLVVARKAPSGIAVYSLGAKRVERIVELPEEPRAIRSLTDDRFVVATTAGLLLLDATTGEIVAKSQIVAAQLATYDDHVAALTDTAVEIVGTDWVSQDRIELKESGWSLAAAEDLVLVASPKGRNWQIAGTLAPTQVVAQVVPAPVPSEPSPAASKTPEETPKPPSESDSGEPAVEKPGESVSTPEPEHVSAQPEEAKEEVSAPTEETPRRARGPLRRVPLGSVEPSAPSPGRPSVLPFPPGSQKRITDVLKEGPQLPSEEPGFQAPDWTQPWKNIKADKLQYPLYGDQPLQAEGNVRLELENTRFAADAFYYHENLGEMRATGNVTVTQDQSALYADEVYYKVSVEPLAEAPYPLEIAGVTEDEQAREKRRLSMGRVEASQVRLYEPARELTANRLVYDLAQKTGEADVVQGRAGIYYFGADRLRLLGPRSFDGEDVWVTTCDHDPPHYVVRLKKASVKDGKAVIGTNARLQLGGADTPVYWPKWAHSAGGKLNFDFASGHNDPLGYYASIGQRFSYTPDIDLGLRLYPTEREGVGLGVEGDYDFMETPASPWFRSKGSFQSLYTTKDRGYFELYHRHELRDDAILLVQSEQWSDRDFYKDFHYDAFRNRTEPRTFANLTYTQPKYIATGTIRKTTNSFVHETERLPEATFHLLERRLTDNLYLTFDTVDGYNEREPAGTHAVRFVNVARLTYDLDLESALTIAPFLEVEGSWYSDERSGESSEARFAGMVGTTLQTRLQKTYPGAFGFAAFKHVLVPSVTYSYRPESTMDVEETPRFDAYDNVYGHSRLESKIDNILYGRDAHTQEVWQVARLTFYQGNDFWNELRRSTDYEVELDLRPRPWWGFQLAGEHHGINKEYDLDEPFFLQRFFLELYEDVRNKPYDPEIAYQYDARYGDYDRILTYLYYDDTALGGTLSSRLGFAYTETQDRVFNREVLYGLGFRLGEHWGVSFEHRYDFERGDLYLQKYELRRDLHCWEAAIQFRDREEGWDFSLEFNIKAFPGTKVKF
ncbi:MAG: LPS assembly protein LptD [Candidatus Hydrogenedentes bacterium]|nr:LPS assembly protein LptD [Candidatus Hydrogenedentota bacterium]